MRNIIAFVFLFLIFRIDIFGQDKEIPTNIEEAIQILDRNVPGDLKEKIKRSGNDSLLEVIRPFSNEYFAVFTWTGKDSIFRSYYDSLKIYDFEKVEFAVLTAFKRYLNGQPINHDEIIMPFRLAQEKWEEEYKVRFTRDSLQGKYIPKSLEDCFKQIDKFWKDSTKQKVRNYSEREFVNNAHLGFGMWMRNNWKLWAGSRLTLYFNNLGIYHAEDMSGIILLSYHRYLGGKAIDLDGQIKKYQYYHAIAKMPEMIKFPPGIDSLEFRTTQFYKSKKYYEGALHFADPDSLNNVWLYDYHLGWAKIPDSKLLAELKGKKYERLLRRLYRKYKIKVI